MNSNSSNTNADEWFCTPAEYEQYLSRSLPPRVQRELEKQVQEELLSSTGLLGVVGGGGQEEQARAVVGLLQRMQLRLFRQLEHERRNNNNTGTGDDGGQ